MPDFKRMRQNMVSGQLLAENITNPALLEAFLSIPREKFVPRQFARIAYMDADLTLSQGRTLHKPSAMARFLMAAPLRPSEAILYLGTDILYGPALLGKMGFSVTALIPDEHRAEEASALLQTLEIPSVTVLGGHLTKKWEKRTLFDVIFLENSAEYLGCTLLSQLQKGGRLLCFQRDSWHSTDIQYYTKTRGKPPAHFLLKGERRPEKCLESQKIFVF